MFLFMEDITSETIIQRNSLIQGDCLDVLKHIPDNSIDSCVTDPPYGYNIMGQKWDYDVPSVDVWQEVLRVLNPGAHLLCFCGTKTQHRMAVNIEDAGFDIKDVISWVYASGMPKGLNVGRLDEVFEGWHTQLKPSMELITVCMKPISEKTIVENIVKWGTGAMNIEACRIGNEHITAHGGGINQDGRIYGGGKGIPAIEKGSNPHIGRFPANFTHDGSDEVLELFPESKGQLADLKGKGRPKVAKNMYGDYAEIKDHDKRGDEGSAARFFFCAKASQKERGKGNNYPTVKPLKLMDWLCKLVTPTNGVILDPFAGSGTTALSAMNGGFDYILIEKEDGGFETACKRIDDYLLANK